MKSTFNFRKSVKNLKAHLILSIVIGAGLAPAKAQSNFKWDVITDSINGNKDEIYSKSKLFIAETWKSAQDVIQLDDKESGTLLIKGLHSMSKTINLSPHKWTFSYSIKLMVKDNKARMIIDDVYCDKSTYVYKIPVADTFPEKKGLTLTGMNEKKYLEVMTELREHLQLIVNEYQLSLKKENSKGGW